MKWLGFLAAIVAAAVVFHKASFPSYSYRYRLQMALAIEDKSSTGSSVIEINWECGPKVADMGQCAPGLRGQAALIDLGSRGVVIAALRSGENYKPTPDGAVDAIWLCAYAFGNQSTVEELPALPRLMGRRDLSPSNFPRLLWVPNPADPKSATKITMQDVANLIDPSARFTEAFVEITKDPIVLDIQNKLPWLPKLVQEQKGKATLSVPGRFQLVYDMFVGDSS